jgi:tetratricopeptide (TPR) repeat protein
MKRSRSALATALTALAASALLIGLISATALAREEKKNEFPNATRVEPKQTTTRAVDDIQKAYDELAEEQYDQAKGRLDKVLANTRATPYEQALALQGLSQIAHENDDLVGALELNQRALALDVLDNNTQFNLLFQQAQLNLMEERYDAALVAIDEWLRVTALERPDALVVRGNALYRLERYADAIPVLTRAIELSPEPDPSWYQLLVASYTAADRGAEVLPLLEAQLARNPDDKTLIQQAANLYFEAEQNDKAAALLRGAYDRGLLTTAADLRSLWQVYAFLGQADQAAEIINGGIAKGVISGDYNTWKSVGDAYAQAEQWPKALEYYSKAAVDAPDGELDFLRGQLMIQETDQLDEGKAAIEKALQRGGLKREGEAWILLGMAEEGLNNQSAAEAAFRKATGFDSSRSMAEQWLRNIKR